MLSKRPESPRSGQIEVLLDGRRIDVPPERRSLSGIYSFLDMMALEQQRMLYWFCIDGRPTDPAELSSHHGAFVRIEAASLDLPQFPLQLLQTARRQAAQAAVEVQSAVSAVLINDIETAREMWWKLAGRLKSPLLTLSLLPVSIWRAENGRVTLGNLRQWQLRELASLTKDVDDACWAEDTRALSNALEQRVLQWLETLGDSLDLWLETLQIESLVAARPAVPSLDA